MFSTIKDICKVTFSITKNTAKLSGEALKLTNDFIKSEEFKDGLQFVNEGLESLNEGAKAMNKATHIWSCKSHIEHKVKMLRLKSYAVVEEVLMSFGDVELLKKNIIKFINSDIENINNKFNVNISFIEQLSLDDFIKTIDSIIVDDLSMNKIDDLFDALNSIELTSKINKDKIEELFRSLNLMEKEMEQITDMQQRFDESSMYLEFKNQLIEKSIEKSIEKKSVKSELIELLRKDEVFNKILSQ